MKIVHLFDAVTGEYKGDYLAQVDPLTPDAFIAPNCSTDIMVPSTTVNQVAVFKAGAWNVQPDFRGKMIYDQISGSSQQVSDIGALPAGFALTPVQAVPTLAQVQATSYSAIDVQAGITRSKYITTVPGQSETYLSKASDAAAYKAASYPSSAIANYPMVQAEARAIYGATPTAAQYQSATDGILATQAQWIGLSAAIEQQRRAGKIAVGAAATVAVAIAAQQAAITALQAL